MLHDNDIREPLFDYLDERYGKNRILEEKPVGKSRADVLMVTEDALYGIEIKSDADTYARLETQVRDYNKFFDYNYVVVGSSHGLHIREHVPEFWGVITVEEVDGTLDFYILREPAYNPKMKIKYKLQLLWRPELAMIQEWNDMPKYKNLGKKDVIKKIEERLNFEEGKKGKIDAATLQKQISQILLERDYSNVKAMLAEYRKGELQKKIEAETDPSIVAALLKEQEAKKEIMIENGKKRVRYRRRRRKKKV